MKNNIEKLTAEKKYKFRRDEAGEYYIDFIFDKTKAPLFYIHNSIESSRVLKDILEIGKFIEDSIEGFDDELKFPTLALFEKNDSYIDYIDEAYEKNNFKFKRLIEKFFKKHNIVDISCLYRNTPTNISHTLTKFHFLYQLFQVLKFINGNKKASLKTHEIVDDKTYLKTNLAQSLSELNSSHQIIIKYDVELDKFEKEVSFSTPLDAGIWELTSMLAALNCNYTDYFLSVCPNCGDIFKSTNKNKKYCGQYECTLACQRERKNRSNAKKRKEAEINDSRKG